MRLSILLAMLFLGAWTNGARAGDALKPMPVIIITADDMNADSPGWMGNPLKPTPSLDKFAATCHRFTQAHVTAPICQPSRSAIMTGRVPHRSGALGFHPIRNDVTTLVALLARRGYYTAAINKIPHMMPVEKFNWDSPLKCPKNPKSYAEQVRVACQAAGKAKKPLFLNVNITDPHRPFPGGAANPAKAKKNGTGDSTVTPYKPEEVRVPSFLEDIPGVRQEVAQYLTGVHRFDLCFAEVLEALRQEGLLDQALIVFLSDHGMSFPFSKATTYHNGTWSPVILRWPGMGTPIENKTDLVSSVDIVPTILDILGMPALAGADGRSWLPLCRGERQPHRDHVITHVNTVSSGASFPMRCVRTLTRSYIWEAWPDGQKRRKVEAMSGLSFKAMAAAGQLDPKIQSRVQQYHLGVAHALYDLAKDPDERVNRFNDAAYAADQERLQQLLLGHMERTNDPQIDAFRKSLGGAVNKK
jgi:N-sulfoglucosamine sulfohydrolase